MTKKKLSFKKWLSMLLTAVMLVGRFAHQCLCGARFGNPGEYAG